jgi:superfamily II DNA or RNA helicase
VIGEAQERALSTPRPKVRLFADKAIVGDSYREEEIPLVALAFDYGSRVIDADENLAFDFAGVRNPRAENDARRILENFGLVDLACLETIAVAPGVAAHYALACEGDVHRYCAFSAYVVPQLRALGFEVTVDRGYPYDARAGDAWYLEVGEEGDEQEKTRDWFNLELGVEIDGRRTNLLPTLLDLLNQHRGRLRAIESGGSRHIAVKTEQGYVSVPRERLKMLFEVLVELHRVSLQKRGEIFIPIDDTSVLRLLGNLGERARFERGAKTDRLLSQAVAPKAPPVPPPPGLRAELRPYQAEGLAWLAHLKSQGLGGILADEMGLGKTLQLIAHLLAESDREKEEYPQVETRRPSLVIAPTSLVSGWAREIAKFAPSLNVVILHGHKRHRRREEARRADIVITTYPLLVRDEEELVRDPYRILVLDEAHTIKNPRSETHRAAQKLVADQRIALSGTPLENHLGELFAIAEFVAPGALGDELGFRRAYRSDETDRLGALRSRLASFVLRRTKDEVAKDLPPKTEIARPVSLAGRQRDLYEAIRISAHAQVRHAISERGLAASTVSILDALLKLREVCCDPRLVRLNAATSVKESAKLEAFLELVAAERRAGRRILVFSQFTRMIALLQAALEARGIPPLVLTGQTRERQRVIDAFEKDRAADVFLLSLKAAGVGLTLTSAETVIHYDPWWNPAVQDQATDRAHRIGQKKPVFVHTLFVAGSVEERLLALQERKRRLARAVLDGATDAKMSIEDVDYLFAPLGG